MSVLTGRHFVHSYIDYNDYVKIHREYFTYEDMFGSWLFAKSLSCQVYENIANLVIVGQGLHRETWCFIASAWRMVPHSRALGSASAHWRCACRLWLVQTIRLQTYWARQGRVGRTSRVWASQHRLCTQVLWQRRSGRVFRQYVSELGTHMRARSLSGQKSKAMVFVKSNVCQVACICAGYVLILSI